MSLGLGIGKGGKLPISPIAPDGLSNLVQWLETDSGVTQDGTGSVSVWADQSDQSNDVSQVSGSDQPIWTANQLGTHPAILFDGVSEYLQRTSFTGGDIAQPFTVIFVFKGAWSNNKWMISGGANNPTVNFPIIDKGTTDLKMYDGAYYKLIDPFTNVWRVMSVVAGVGAGASNLHINGSYINSGNQGTNNSAWRGVTIAADDDGTNATDLELVALVVYSDGKSSNDILRVHKYLNNKYGVY